MYVEFRKHFPYESPPPFRNNISSNFRVLFVFENSLNLYFKGHFFRRHIRLVLILSGWVLKKFLTASRVHLYIIIRYCRWWRSLFPIHLFFYLHIFKDAPFLGSFSFILFYKSFDSNELCYTLLSICHHSFCLRFCDTVVTYTFTHFGLPLYTDSTFFFFSLNPKIKVYGN